MDPRKMPPRMPPGAQTLVKYLVSAGLGARRDAADLIMQGHVRVNGMPASDLNHPVRPRDRVDVDGAAVRPPEGAKPVYLLLNKPKGYLSAVRDDRGRKTVLDLVPEEHRMPGLVPAGRLDLDSTGLMLLTNDGDLVDMVTHPSYGVEKEYRVVIDRPLTQDRVHALVNGIALEDGVAKAKQVRKLSEDAGAYSYAITLVEGKKREVRRMLMEVGRRVLELERTRMGNITLGQLPSGQVRQMTSGELRGLLAVVDRRPNPRPTSPDQADRNDDMKGPRRPRPYGGRDQERWQGSRSGSRERGEREGERERPLGRSRPYGDRDQQRPPRPRSASRGQADDNNDMERPRRPRPYEGRDQKRPPERRERSEREEQRERPQGRPRAYGDRERLRERGEEQRPDPRGRGGDRSPSRGPARPSGGRGSADRDTGRGREQRSDTGERRGGESRRPPADGSQRRHTTRPGGGRPRR